MASSHKGYPDSYWASKIKELATGKPFGKGERPRKGTKWDLVSKEVEKCPKHRNASNVGKAIHGYHKPKTSPPPVSTVITIHFRNIWNKKNAHACSIQNICTRLMHLNFFQILSAIKMHG